MDPLECLRRALRAQQNAEYMQSLEALFDYYNWRVRGGFEPAVDGERGDVLAYNLACDVLDGMEGK